MSEISEFSKNRMEKNRLKAIALRSSKLVNHPYSKTNGAAVSVNNVIKIGTVTYKDTGGGFLLEQHSENPEETSNVKVVQQKAPIAELPKPKCESCDKPFATSWLFDHFNCYGCDECKETSSDYNLIAKTEAKTKYLLQDCDLDKREPPLKYISRKNPHNVRWGEMKLYLECQIIKRAIDVWESMEKLEEEKERREERNVLTKSKKFQKKLKELRMNMRSSLYDKTSSASHTHQFDTEIYNEDDDNYTRKCTICNFEETFEKM